MNTLDYYSRQKESWDEREVLELQYQYQVNNLSVSEIADLHRRTPGSISYKLKSIGLVMNHTDVRGYEEYKNSKLYSEIVNKSKITKTVPKEKREKITTTKNLQDSSTSTDILAELKKITYLLTELINIQKEVNDTPKKSIKNRPIYPSGTITNLRLVDDN